MKVVVGNLWDSSADILTVTTNATIATNGLVMGRGAAFQASQKIQRLPRLAARTIESSADYYVNGYPVYGFRVVDIGHRQRIGLFQVKLHFKDEAALALIGLSVVSLASWLCDNPQLTVAMNFPGIGFGQLAREQVEPVLSMLPDTVCVHVFETYAHPNELKNKRRR